MAIRASIVAATLLLALTARAGAEEAVAAPEPCSGAEHGQLDFWLGEWIVSWDGGQGYNTVSKTLDGCVVEENFEGGPSVSGLNGRSLSTFHARSGNWRQVWTDNRGGFFSLKGGPEGADFVLRSVRDNDAAPHLRMLFTDIAQDSLTWRWQRSADGAAWQDLWVIRYARAPEEQ